MLDDPYPINSPEDFDNYKKEQLENAATDILDSYERIIEELKNARGGLDAFLQSKFAIKENGKSKGYSNSNLNPYKIEVDRLKSKIREKKKLVIPFEKDPAVIKLRSFLKDASMYLDHLKKETLAGKSWCVFYSDIPAKGIKRSTQIGKAILNFEDENCCSLVKVDFDLEESTLYKGWYMTVKEKKETVISVSLKNKNRVIHGLIHKLIKSSVSVVPFEGFGFYHQFDGKRIHSGLIVALEWTGGTWNLTQVEETLKDEELRKWIEKFIYSKKNSIMHHYIQRNDFIIIDEFLRNTSNSNN